MMRLDGSSFGKAAAALADADPSLAGVIQRAGLPAFWHRPPGFATLVLFILEQQVSLASARAVFGRLVERVGTLTPEAIARLDDDGLGRIGLTRQKQRYVRGLAGAVIEGSIDLDGLEDLSDEEARRQLLRLTGIGPWTADVYLLSALGRPDVWPVGDRALQVGTAETLALPEVPDPVQLEQIGARWRPWRSVAARLIWHDYLSRRGRTEPALEGLAVPGASGSVD